MFVPGLWLKDYVNINDDIKTFTRRMTVTGTMVEGYEYRGGLIENVVAAKVVSVERHPDSDHMWICVVTDGTEDYTVVTGAQNVKAGDIVPFAKDNSFIADGKNIKASNLRGIMSEGMLCSAGELGINSSIAPKHTEDGIYILPENTKIGEDIKKVLGLDDYIIEFELTNNRQDCNSVLGIAYEAAASSHQKFNMPEYEFNCTNQDIENYISVEVKNQTLCPRYTAKMVKVKKVEPSPMWMQVRLMGSGVRPINNIVDVSNFVMLETGQPLHTFDYDKIAGHKIIVDTAKNGETLVTLDGVERKLDDKCLMIDDASGHIGLAGIMGGGNSDIDENTKYVVIEAANFNGTNIRNSAKYLGLRTEASAHFEKGISINLTKFAADRAASLLVEIGAAEYVDGVIDIYKEIPQSKEISIDIDWYNKFIGRDITVDQAAEYLDYLLMEPRIEGNVIFAHSPRFRQDIEIKEDLAEEITRIHGYDKIPLKRLEESNYISAENKHYKAKQKIKRTLIAIGGCDTLTYSFISPDAIKALNLQKEDSRNNPMVLLNPLGSDNSVMRTLAISGMLETLKLNYNKKNEPKLMFEICSVYSQKENSSYDLPEEKEKLTLGKFNTDFYEIKSALQYLFETFKIDNIEYIRADETFLHPGRSAYVLLNGKNIGFIGQIHPQISKLYGICDETCVAELELEPIINESMANEDVTFKTPPKYPFVERDLALIADDNIMAGDIKNAIREASANILRSCEVFDIYKNASLGEGKKSIAFSLKFRKDDDTLKDEEVDEQISAILKNLKDKLKISLR